MEYLNSLLTLAGVMVLSVISPGPNFAVVSSTALSVSRKAGVLTALGLALASITWGTLSIVGIQLVLAHASWLYSAIQIAGGLYLIWLGSRMVWAARAVRPEPSTAAPQSGTSFVGKGYLVSMTSPKALAFYASVFVTFVPENAPLWVYIALVMIPTTVAGIWYSSVALALTHGPIQQFFDRSRTLLDSLLGLFLLGFGIHLLWSSLSTG